MKAYYIDIENTGLAGVNSIHAGPLDKVFVFTNSPGQTQTCKEISHQIACLGGYPCGANQADFFLLAHLVRLLDSLNLVEKQLVEMVLHTRDINLWRAFHFQCLMARVPCSAPLIVTDIKITALDAPSSSLVAYVEQQILQRLATKAMRSSELEAVIGVEQPVFVTAFNHLIAAQRVKRKSATGNGRKKWLKA